MWGIQIPDMHASYETRHNLETHAYDYDPRIDLSERHLVLALEHYDPSESGSIPYRAGMEPPNTLNLDIVE